MIELVPAIDIIGGKCVRLSQGDYGRSKTYSEDPVQIAKAFEDHGIKRLHLVDLDGAKSKHIVNHKTLAAIASATSLVIDFGGGLKSDDDLRIAFENGASMITGGSIAVTDEERFSAWLTTYGADKIILGADAKDGKIAINGWQENTDESLEDFIKKYTDKGISKAICTDIGRDGMLQGPAIDLYASVLERFPELYLIASGGVSSMDDIRKLDEAKVPAVIFGKAFYEGNISLKDMEKFYI